MPTKKRRVGFIPRDDVLKIIERISNEENLSNSKVISFLIEEALTSRGLFDKKKLKKITFNSKQENSSKNFKIINDNLLENDYELIDNREINKLNESFEEYNKGIDHTDMYKRFIQFLHFKRMMKIFERYL
tara:strand:+ start:239 stop:631 length:393 start_codon:yes stop_codon:yes gene_type:complete